MSTIVTRAGKGSPLTHNEVDANFTNLNTDKAEVASSNTFSAAQTFSSQLNLTNASNYNLYASGAGNNYMAGALGIGSTSLTGINLRLSKNQTGGTNTYGIYNDAVIQSDATGTSWGIYSAIGTAAASFTVSDIRHIQVGQGTFGAGSAVTTQFGISIAASLTGATNNYAFYGNIAAATGRYNLYMAGTANNYMAGSLGIGVTPASSTIVYVSKTTTDSTAYSVFNAPTAGSATTTALNVFSTSPNTQAAAFTLGSLNHFNAVQGSVGATSAITTQNGFNVNSNLTGATNNFAFYGQLAAATGRYNLYMAGTADNYLAGKLGIGVTPAENIDVMANGRTYIQNTRYSDNALQPAFSLRKARGTNASPTIVTSGDSIGSIQSYGYDGSNFVISSQIDFAVDATPGTNDMPGRIVFYTTADGASTTTERMRLDSSGNLGVGVTPSAGRTLEVGKSITGSTGSMGILSSGQIQSDVTAQVRLFSSYASTQAASFTLSQLWHYYATQGTIGAGSAVTTQQGFLAESTLTGATNNFGFYGNLAAATGRYNLYMAGTADNYLAGSLGIGSTTLTAHNLKIQKNLTGATVAYGISNLSAIQSDVTGQARYNSTYASTAAAAFTLNELAHYYASQGTFGASSAVTYQYGYYVESSLTSATYNYGFHGNIAAGTNRYNLYMAGTANNYLAGSLGIGTVSVTGTTLNLGKTITGATNAYSVYNSGAIQSDVTGSANMYLSYPTTAATAFTLPTLRHFYAALGGIGAGSAITTQIGYVADASVIGATNNYSFYGGIAAAAGRYNLYMAGTATNYLGGQLQVKTADQAVIGFFAGATYATRLGANGSYAFVEGVDAATGTTSYQPLQIGGSLLKFDTGGTERMRIDASGNVGIGGTFSLASLALRKNITGGTQAWNYLSYSTVQSDVTSDAYMFGTFASTAATSFTLTNLIHYHANKDIIGATSTVTNQSGFVATSNITGATNNYGFRGSIAAATGRYNLYMDGTAANYLAGSLGIGIANTSGYGKLTVEQTSSGTALQLKTPSNTNGIYSVLYEGFFNTLYSYGSQFIVGTTDATAFVINTNNTERMKVDSSGNVLVTGAGGLGYGTGSGGAVTQATSRTTGVTLNKTNGAITLVSAAGSATYQSFTVTNSTVAATDTIIVNQKSGTDKYIILVTAVAAGSFNITFATTGGTTTEQPVFNFAVIKAVTA